jgi:hypothetical protein
MKKLARANTVILRGAILAFLIVSMSLMPTVQANGSILFDDKGAGYDGQFEATPTTVGTSSNLKFKDVELEDGTSFLKDGCIEIDFEEIAQYAKLKGTNQ